jgi:crotonobetainyl-CoA:carnitine CoA-transferase CaiB-like acyl-CoA transferase
VLDGIKVVDCSTEIAGPYCTKLLVDAGADVVKVDPPNGDPLRCWGPSADPDRGIPGALYEFLTTSKRVVTGSLTDPAVQELCVAADVLVESGFPGQVDVRGLQERNPALVVVSITPFGQTGPWAARPGTEFTLQAWCGSIASRGLPEDPPVAAGGRIGEWMAGTYAAVATTAALRAARRDGLGEHIDVAWLDCMALTMNTYTVVFAELQGWPPLQRPTRMIEIPSIEPTADGYACFTTNSAQQFADFLVLIGRPDLLEDRDLASHLGRWRRRDEFLAMTHAYTTKHTTAEVLEAAALLRIPSGPTGNGATVTGFDHFVERGVFVDSPLGRFRQVRVPYAISGAAPRPFTCPTETTIEAVGWGTPADARPLHRARSEARPSRWVPGDVAPRDLSRDEPTTSRRLPLDGVRVLDLTAWWAGPAASHMLAVLGADVIKVESTARPDLMRYTSVRPPTEDHWWEWGPLWHGVNNTKRGVTLDLTKPEGNDLLRRLLRHADVLIENFTPRVMENFGFTWDVVHAENPRLVMTRMPAYGLDGPWRDRTGFAQTMESITGMAWVTGWPDGPPLLPRGPCDPLAAMHAVYATLLALEVRDRTGEGTLVEVSMIEAALNAAAEQVVEYEASGTLLGRQGNRGPGAAPQGVYACAGHEQWIAISVTTDEHWDALRRLLGQPEWAADPTLRNAAGRHAAHDRIDAELARWCSERDALELAEQLTRAGIPAAYVTDAREIVHNPQLVSRRFFEIEDHPLTGPIRIPMVPFRYASRREVWMRGPAPLLGQHTEEVLRELLGLTDLQLERLRDAEVIGTRPKGA